MLLNAFLVLWSPRSAEFRGGDADPRWAARAVRAGPGGVAAEQMYMGCQSGSCHQPQSDHERLVEGVTVCEEHLLQPRYP